MDEIDGATRLKQIRNKPITRGRAKIRLFEKAPEGERPHPRLRLSFVEVDDPSPPPLPDPERWPDVAAFRRWLRDALDSPRLLAGLDNPPAEDPHYWRNTLRAQRLTALLDHAREAIKDRDGWSSSKRNAARYAVAELGALAHAGFIEFDNEDSGTYHSYRLDQPFVHVLERIRNDLPKEDSEAFALLPSEQQYAVRRERKQVTNHLDFVMRYKYAFNKIVETDIERNLGGFLIDRKTRQIVSEDPKTRKSLQPRHQLLRIDPDSNHPRAGAYVMRTPDGLALADGTPVTVAQDQLRVRTIPKEQLTFKRAPNNPRLRQGVRFDWNGDGYVEGQALDWIAWAGHCDVKAVLEQFGLALLEQHSLYEYRSDTGKVTELDRSLLLELLSAVVEFGSIYLRLDGSGEIVRGKYQYGGARNDELPDRLQFRGPSPDQHFRWPLSPKREALQITKIVQNGKQLDLDTAFSSCIPDLDAVDFSPNPRYRETVDEDYNVINATGMRLSGTTQVMTFDSAGRLKHSTEVIEIDLRSSARGRSFLGTHLNDAAKRELYRVYLDHDQPAIIAELWRWSSNSGKLYHADEGDIVLPLADPLSTTVSREQRLEDPEAFTALLDVALRQGQNIVADTDAKAPVWNGVVTAMNVERLAVNEEARTERWQVLIGARFGVALLDYIVRRSSDGTPKEYCPVPGGMKPQPDFMYQELPDIASKGVEDGAWVVNRAMVEREIVDVEHAPQEQGDWYVYDDYVKNAYEILYAALAGYRWTIVHQNKRYVFASKSEWTAARERLDALREKLRFDD